MPEDSGSVLATFKMLALWLTLGPIVGVIGIVYTLVAGDVTRFYWAVMWLVRRGVRAAGITVQVEGLEHIPAGRACIFMSNHVSNLDPPVLMPAIPTRMAIMLKKSLMSIPILGTAMRMARFIPVDRGSRRDAAKAMVAAAAATLADGLPIVVFPEGTRSPDGRLSTFKKGPFFLAQQTGAPIVPVALSGTQKMLRKGSNRIAPGVARIQMLAAIDPRDYASREALTAAVRAAIAAALPAEMKPLDGVKMEAI